MTYAGVAMTQLTSVNASNVSTGETNYLFGLANPALGANNIVISGTLPQIGVVATSFNGAQQTTAVEASNTGTGASGTATVSVTTLTNNDWLVGFARGQSNTTAGTNTLIRAAMSNINAMDSNGAQTPAGFYSLNFTTAGNNNWASQIVALKPFAAAAASPPFLPLLGVGI